MAADFVWFPGNLEEETFLSGWERGDFAGNNSFSFIIYFPPL